ncbi:MAG: class I SAM-dependent methyltransferase [Opitutales bacterium]
MAEIKTDEKKQHFDDIYIAEDPVPFKERIIDALDYISDDFNRAAFDRLVLPWAQERAQQRPLNLVDLCCCFGNTTMAVANGMTVEEIRTNWASDEAARQVARPRRLPINATGIDISENALNYTRSAGIFDHTIHADLNQASDAQWNELEQTMGQADVLISTAALVYLETSAIQRLVKAFANGSKSGYALVNFLNPFALEKADETKRILLEHLDFLGSQATRHRRMSQLEQDNYPGEEWSLLEIWVLRRR